MTNPMNPNSKCVPDQELQDARQKAVAMMKSQRLGAWYPPGWDVGNGLQQTYETVMERERMNAEIMRQTSADWVNKALGGNVTAEPKPVAPMERAEQTITDVLAGKISAPVVRKLRDACDRITSDRAAGEALNRRAHIGLIVGKP